MFLSLRLRIQVRRQLVCLLNGPGELSASNQLTPQSRGTPFTPNGELPDRGFPFGRGF